jgi:hypothetical protein
MTYKQSMQDNDIKTCGFSPVTIQVPVPYSSNSTSSSEVTTSPVHLYELITGNSWPWSVKEKNDHRGFHLQDLGGPLLRSHNQTLPVLGLSSSPHKAGIWTPTCPMLMKKWGIVLLCKCSLDHASGMSHRQQGLNLSKTNSTIPTYWPPETWDSS